MISGILLVFPFSLLNLEWVVWFALVPLLLATVRVNSRDSFVLGYLCGVVWNTGSLFWMHVYAPLALPLVVLILSFYPAFFCLGLNTFCGGRIHPTRNDGRHKCRPYRRGSVKLVLQMMCAAPLLWVSLEYVRSLGFLGFPWNSLGYSQYGQISVIQMAEFTGVYGVSFLIVFVNSGIACCLLTLHERWKCLKIIATVGIVLGLSIFWGRNVIICSGGQDTSPPLLLYAPTLLSPTRGEGERKKLSIGGLRKGATDGGVVVHAGENPLTVVLVQGNFGTDCYWEDSSPDIMRRLSTLSLGAAVSEPDLIVWPETAIGENPEIAFAVDSWLRREISHVLRETGAYLATGAHYDCDGRAYNSVFLVSPACEVVDRYDKMHLVPAAEYFPFWRHTRLIEYLLRDAGDFTPGVRGTIFEIPGGGKFAALICFEGIFGDFTRRFVKDGAEFLVNITNDVWSGSETSHHQHAAMASFRAVENRVYFLRLGNSGISRVINPYGIIERELGVYRSGILMGEVFPQSGQTFYARSGDVFAKVVFTFAFLLFFLSCPFGRRLRPF